MATSVYLLQTKDRNGKLPLLAANGNGKQTFVFLGR
jgi:hypothetical protein